MATIITKNSSTASSAPTSVQLVQGELAVNVTDKRLFTENNSGAIVELGVNPSTLTVTAGAVVEGLTVGRGAGAGSTNTAVGASALATNSSGSSLTAVGANSLLSNTTGNWNTGVGIATLYSNTTGTVNSAVGQNALYFNTTGAQNTGVGAGALYNNTTASYNTAVGCQAGYSNTTGAENTFVGYQAGLNKTTGTYNTVLGSQAFRVNATGNDNTLIGVFAGYVLTGSNNTFVGARSTTTYGCGELVTTGSKNTILGGYNGNQGVLDIRTADNYIVLSDGDGNPLISTNSSRSVALNGAVPQTGTGITFPATQSASSDANTLDDYEEGTWTPVQGSGLTVVGAFSSSGQYTKIGRSVTVFGLIAGATSVACTANGQLCTGLPFTPNTEFQGALINAARSFSNNVGALGSGAVQNSTALAATTSAAFTITYFV